MDYSYLMGGIKPVTTESSVLVSSSRYLNDPRIRDWVSTHMLRRNGPDVPTTSDSMGLTLLLREVQDIDRINALIAQERARNPKLDSWFAERFVSTFTIDDLAQYGPDTAAGLFHHQLVAGDMQINLVPPFEPKNDFEYYQLRAGQCHDWEHLLGGGGFDFIGELVPYYMRLAGLFLHLSAELAGELSVFSILGSSRIMTRAVLHYPQTWLAVLDAVERGIHVGRQSGPFFMARYEDVFHLPLDEARAAIGIRGVVERDTATASAQWS